MIEESGFNDIPLESMNDPPPPSYKPPEIDFHRGWRDIGFTIAFWIQALLVIITGLIFGIQSLLLLSHDDLFHQKLSKVFDLNVHVFFYSIYVAIIMAIICSFMTIFLLEKFAALIIIISLIVIIAIEITLAISLSLIVDRSVALIPVILLVVTIIFACCIRRRIPFTAIHLQTSCTILRAHPSLLLVSIVMRVVQLLWLICWSLLVISFIVVSVPPPANSQINESKMTPTRREYNLSAPENSTLSRQEKSHLDYSFPTLGIVFLLLIPAFWGLIAFGNLDHFINACTVGRWWFPEETAQQYLMKTSIKRAWTTNFGTICFGSLIEAIVTAFRSVVETKQRRGLCTATDLPEKLVAYINEWGFIFAALTGQSFVEACKSLFALFRQRGWTMILNDSVVGYCLGIVNFLVGLLSALAGGLIFYLFEFDSSTKLFPTLYYVASIYFLLGVILNSFVTTILTSCVRALFVCFALNPAALGATHPDQLQKFSEVWHQVYPKEYANSNYDQNLPLIRSKYDV